jgi:hypothetical protein
MDIQVPGFQCIAQQPVDQKFVSIDIQGGLKSEVQHLPPSKVRRCKSPRREDINNSSLKTA